METIRKAWRRVQEHPIKAEDADAQGCVLAWHIHQGCLVVERHWAERNTMITHWMPLPSAPDTVYPADAERYDMEARRTRKDG